MSEITAVEFDRISIVHAVFFAFVATFWMIGFVIGRRLYLFASSKGRLIYSIAGSMCVALGILLIFPKFYKGPLADVDPRIYAIWFSHIAELQPLLEKDDSLILFIQAAGPLLFSIIYLIYKFPKISDLRIGWQHRKSF